MKVLVSIIKYEKQWLSPIKLIMKLCCFLIVIFSVMGMTLQTANALNAKVLKYSKLPQAEKISVNLLRIANKAKTQNVSFATAATNTAVRKVASAIAIDIVMNSLNSDIEQQLRIPGVTIRYISKRYKRVYAVVNDPDALYEIAEIPEVKTIMAEYGGILQVGSVTSRAGKALKADIAKTTYNLDGTGQTVGILSDSFACNTNNGNRDANTSPAPGVPGILTGSPSQDSLDLPASVQIISDLDQSTSPSCTDEGAAMGELVHDITPGANIVFASADLGKAGFADGINQLCSTSVSATVVVDDISYFGEPMYQDGIIAQAAANCVTKGIPYYSSAGNQANNGFKENYSNINTVIGSGTSAFNLQDWRFGYNSIRDGFIAVTLQPNQSVSPVLEWNQPFDSVSSGNGSQIDMDLYITPTPDDAGINNPLSLSTDFQGTSGAPSGDAVEVASYTNNTSAQQTVYIAVNNYAGNQDFIPQAPSIPVELRLVFYSHSSIEIENIADTTSVYGASTIYGHSMALGVISVAAVPWYDTASFDPLLYPTGSTDPEPFTARGGNLTVQFDKNGSYVPRTSFEPDIASVDGNDTRFFGQDINLGSEFGEPDGFPNFFGTSAAAPNAAAVAALIRQKNPALTPEQINSALENTTIDITGKRASTGRDDVTGYGLIDANSAIAASTATTNSAPVANAGPDQNVSTGSTVTLDGSGSTDADGDPLTYNWSFVSRPAGSSATLSAPNTVNPTFTTDVDGPYVVQLVVNDGTVDSSPDVMVVSANGNSVNDGGSGNSGNGGGGCTIGGSNYVDFSFPLFLLLSVLYLFKKNRQITKKT